MLLAAGAAAGLAGVVSSETIANIAPEFRYTELLEESLNLRSRHVRLQNQWAELQALQRFDRIELLDVLPIPQLVWSRYMAGEVVHTQIRRSRRQAQEKKWLIYKLYSRPGLLSGIRIFGGITGGLDLHGTGVMFLESICDNLRNDVETVIVTKDVSWAVEIQNAYSKAYLRPAPVVCVVGDNKCLRECLGSRVKECVAWDRDQATAIRLGMLYNCKVAKTVYRENWQTVRKHPLRAIQEVIASAEPWGRRLSRLWAETEAKSQLLDRVGGLSLNRLSEVSVRMQREVRKFLGLKDRHREQPSPNCRSPQ